MQTPEQVLDGHGVNAADIEDMLDELQKHVESIDLTNDLHSTGGLVPLLGCLKNSHANIRAKAAEVLTTIVQNNPRRQQQVMDANGLEPLLSNFTSDPDVNDCTQHSEQYPSRNILIAGWLTALIRHSKAGVAAFRLANGYAALRDDLSSESVKFQRQALNLIQYLLQESHSDRNEVTELGFPRMMTHVASSGDADVIEAALRGLLELFRDMLCGQNDSLDDEDEEKLKQTLHDHVDRIGLMSQEDLDAAREERQLMDSLCNACYKEPSPFRERGLLVLLGEDEPSPDVASKHFETPLRALAAKPENAHTGSSTNSDAETN